MYFCKKCGKQIDNNAKFCPNCGTPINLRNSLDDKFSNSEYDIDNDSFIDDDEENFIVDKKLKKKKLKIIIPIISFIILAVIVAIGVFIKTTSDEKEKLKQSIEITNVDATNYPNIVVSIKANNYQNSLDVKKFTLKENDTFQKDLSLNMELEGNDYKLSYKTSDESTSGNRDIKVAYSDNDNEAVGEESYTAPKKSKESTSTIASNNNSNNVVNTYDNNGTAIKQAIDNYEKAYIRMVNSKDTYYIKDAIDLSGGLMNEFTTTVKSFSEQRIDEQLMDYKIENINKINDQQYEVTNYEKYYIEYNKENRSAHTDFRITYVLNNTGTGFKVYSIKKIDNLGSK